MCKNVFLKSRKLVYSKYASIDHESGGGHRFRFLSVNLPCCPLVRFVRVQEEQHQLKNELAELAITLNMIAQKGRVQQFDYDRSVTTQPNPLPPPPSSRPAPPPSPVPHPHHRLVLSVRRSQKR